MHQIHPLEFLKNYFIGRQMPANDHHVIVVGCGMGGMAAAVSALEGGAQVTVLERAPESERGGRTRYTEAYFRMKSRAAAA
jgi:tricarballylate dehydrogenase